MEAMKIVSISELLQLSRPLTGTSSLETSSCTIARDGSDSRSASQVKRKSHHLEEGQASYSECASLSNGNFNPRFLGSLHYPTIIIGALDLPAVDDSSSSRSCSCISNDECFSFSDGSGRVCCAVLDLDVKIIGKCIHVLAWNFLPLKGGGGFLEIIRWRLPYTAGEIKPCSNMQAFPLVLAADSSGLKARSRVHGQIASVSPVSVLPCTFGTFGKSRTSPNTPCQESNGTRNMSGFVMEVMGCGCNLCSSEAFLIDLHHPNQGKVCHSYANPIIVYFLGSASSWHPVITKLLGNVIWLTGLKKKMVFMGKEDSCLIFVTTEKTFLHLTMSPMGMLSNTRPVIKGMCDFGVYTGIVTGIYMQGIIVELDEKVFLLMTDQLLSLTHSIRVGALISVRNVHFVRPKFSWIKMLLLGACFKTSISVKLFSPYDYCCHVRSCNQSLLGKFIDSLIFPVRLWVLLVVSCFKKIFTGMFSEKEILGSKNKEGLAQKYASSCLPSCVFQPRNGVFREFCKHSSCGHGSEPNYGPLKLVVPISNFISHCEITWMKMLVQLKNESGKTGKNNCLGLLCEGKSYGQLIRRIIPSENIGVIIMGSLRISPSSGRLQLIDATGSIDVVIPDLTSNWDLDHIYEVKNYSLVLEGLPAQVDPLVLLENEPFSCRNIFQHDTSTREINTLAIYVHFYMRDATYISDSLHLPSHMDCGINHKILESGAYQLLFITHKFPAAQNGRVGPLLPDRLGLFAEATILRWNLFIHEENSDALPSGIPTVKIKYSDNQIVQRNYLEKVCNERPKVDYASCRPLKPGLVNESGAIENRSGGCLSGSVSRYWGFNRDHHIPYGEPYPVAVKSFNDDGLFRTGILSRTSLNVVKGKPKVQKILLEFVSECISVFQLLQIGGYYIMKEKKGDYLCNLKDGENANCGKALITSKTPLWSLSFSCYEAPPHSELSQVKASDVSPVSDDEVLCEVYSRRELLLSELPSQNPDVYSDIHLHLPTDAISLLREEIKALEEQLILPVAIPGVAIDPTYSGTVVTLHMHNYRLPEGILTSLRGYVVAVHNFDCNCESIGDIHELSFFPGVIRRICIHVSINSNIVKIQGALSEQAYPIGMGPGVTATFYRVLVMGQNKLMLTPVSLIVINSILEVNHHYSDTCFLMESIYHKNHGASRDMVSSGLIFDLDQCLERKPIQLHCRVLAINILVLEQHAGKLEGLQSGEHSKTPVVDIPLAGFVLDDGSTLCCCWANAERAAILMRLNEEIPVKSFDGSCWTLEGTGFQEAKSTSMYRLEKILKKHKKITIMNHEATLDFSSQDLVFSVNSDDSLSNSEEDFLKFIILNACCGPVLNFMGNLMDSSGMELLEEVTEMKMAMHSMKNIWIREVWHLNPLAEARNTIQELLIRQNKLMLTPVSLIVINSIREVNHHYSDTCFLMESIYHMNHGASRDMVSSGLIFEFDQCLERKPIQLHCRVLAINILVLDKHAGKLEGLQSGEHSKTPVVDIPLAGFVLDDGSTLCCCWANAERAAILMRLNEEIPVKSFDGSCWTLEGTGFQEAKSTSMYHQEKILKKHNKITIMNHEATLDFSSQNLVFSVNSDDSLSNSEEDFLKFIIFNACCGPVLNFIGNLMDSSGMELLEEVTEMKMAMHSMKNIWIREVWHLNPLAEARNTIQELLISCGEATGTTF